jgi:hypothetical protein
MIEKTSSRPVLWTFLKMRGTWQMLAGFLVIGSIIVWLA